MIIYLGQLLPTTVTEDPANWTLYTITVAGALALGWFVHTRYLCAQVGKLKVEKIKIETENNKLIEEEIKIAGDTLMEIIRHRERYLEACQKCKIHARNLISLIQKSDDIEKIDSERERFCDVFSIDAFNAYSAFCQFESLSRKNNLKGLRSFVMEDLVPELERLNKWKDIINSPNLLERVQKNPLKLEKRSLRPFSEIDRFVPEEEKEEIYSKLSAIIKLLQK